MKSNFKKSFKLAKRKGISRIFLEKQPLIKFGIQYAQRYDYIIGQDVIIISFSDTGLRKIQGNETRPVLDICNKSINDFFGPNSHYTCDFLKAKSSGNKTSLDMIKIKRGKTEIIRMRDDTYHESGKTQLSIHTEFSNI